MDCDTLVDICNGIKSSISLELLDLRHNIFDIEGLQGLINALMETMSIRHLYLETMTINFEGARIMSGMLMKNDCMIEELELNEADFDISSLDMIMEALYKADHLRRLSLAKNELTLQIC